MVEEATVHSYDLPSSSEDEAVERVGGKGDIWEDSDDDFGDIKEAGRGDEISGGLSVRRFRPNIVVEGPAAWNEDDWKVVKIGEVGDTISGEWV